MSASWVNELVNEIKAIHRDQLLQMDTQHRATISHLSAQVKVCEDRALTLEKFYFELQNKHSILLEQHTKLLAK